MIRVTATYPSTEGAKFDQDYYLNQHVALVKEQLGDALLKAEIWSGVGGAPEGPAPVLITAHMYFESPESFGAAFEKAGPALMADIPNFTDIEPIIQVEAQAG